MKPQAMIRDARAGTAMMEYVLLVTVMAIAVMCAATWLIGWDGGDAQDSTGPTIGLGGLPFEKKQGIGPELKGMYQRIQAGIALPAP